MDIIKGWLICSRFDLECSLQSAECSFCVIAGLTRNLRSAEFKIRENDTTFSHSKSDKANQVYQ